MAIHYMPKDWAGHAHTLYIRNAFYMLFQFKLVYILEEVLSPIITPFILLFWLRPQAGKIVDFLRSFTVEVVGVGDVCSFSLMDVKLHGNTEWQAVSIHASAPAPPKKQQADNGKTEMSLLHFHLMNPEWKPDNEGSAFIYSVKGQVQHEVQARSMLFTMGSAEPGTSMLASLGASLSPPTIVNYPTTPPAAVAPAPTFSHRLRGAVSRLEGPAIRHGNSTSLFSSLHSSVNSELPLGDNASVIGSVQTSLFNFHGERQVDNYTRELMSSDMNVAALFLQEINRRHRNSDFLTQEDYYRAVWHSHDDGSPTAGGAVGGTVHSGSAGGQGHGTMPGIVEEGSADDEREVDTSSLMMPPPRFHTADSDTPPHIRSNSPLPRL